MYGNNQYGVALYGAVPKNSQDLTDYTLDLMAYLPGFYKKIINMKELQSSMALEVGQLKYLIDELLNQSFIETATWGLSRWEEVLGITVNVSKPDEFRREIIKAKLRGRGTTTKDSIKRTAESFTNTEVEVIEKNEDSHFIIKFIGMKGIPPNMAGLIKEIDIIKPAHLTYSFEYAYTWWDKLKELTWNDSNQKTWNDLRVY